METIKGYNLSVKTKRLISDLFNELETTQILICHNYEAQKEYREALKVWLDYCFDAYIHGEAK